MERLTEKKGTTAEKTVILGLLMIALVLALSLIHISEPTRRP